MTAARDAAQVTESATTPTISARDGAMVVETPTSNTPAARDGAMVVEAAVLDYPGAHAREAATIVEVVVSARPLPTAKTISSVVNFKGRRYFTVSDPTLSGSWFGETANKAPYGYFQSGWMRFGTVEPKVVASVSMRHEPLPAGGSVTPILMKEDGSFTLIAPSNVANSLGPVSPIDAGLPVGEAVMIHMQLNRGTDPTKAPLLRRYTVRALVTPQRMDEIVVPIIMKNKVQNIEGEGTDLYFDPLTEFDYLKGLESTGRIVRYQEGTSSYRVYVDRVEVKPERWTDDRKFFSGMLMVRLLTVPTS